MLTQPQTLPQQIQPLLDLVLTILSCGNAAVSVGSSGVILSICMDTQPQTHAEFPIPNSVISERRERVFIVLAGIFLSAMTMLNIIGLTRFIQLGPMALAVGVLPYPLTFLCTDLISELYGKQRANFLVTVGFGLNVLIVIILYIAQALPPVSGASLPPWQVLELSKDVVLPSGEILSGSVELFQFVYSLTSGAVLASMVAYVAAQYCDVQLFHFWKNLTKGKHLWLRNNFSTLISQAVDSVMVVLVTFGAVYWAGNMTINQLMVLIGSSYLFKMSAALLDTIPFYILTHRLRQYLHINEEY